MRSGGSVRLLRTDLESTEVVQGADHRVARRVRGEANPFKERGQEPAHVGVAGKQSLQRLIGPRSE